MLHDAVLRAIPLLSCDGAERIPGHDLGFESALDFALVVRLNGIGIVRVLEYLKTKDYLLGTPELFPLSFEGKPIIAFSYSNLKYPKINPDDLMQVLDANALTFAQTRIENVVFGVTFLNFHRS